MKNRTLTLIGALLLLPALLIGCGGSDDGSAAAIEKPIDFATWSANEAEWPDWATEEQPVGTTVEEIATSLSTANRNTRLSEEATRLAVKQYRYAANHYQADADYYNNVLRLAVLLERLRLDHLAYKQIEAIIDSGQTEYVSGERTTVFANTYNPILMRIYARMGFTDKMEEIIAVIDATNAANEDFHPGNSILTFARPYFASGLYDKAMERLAIVNDVTQYSNANSMVPATVGAASLAFRMGEYDKVIEWTQWIIDEGYDSATYVTGSDTRDAQWHACYDQSVAWRELAEAGKAVTFNGLTNGTYSVTPMGFRGTVAMSVTVEGGKLSGVEIEEHVEDRAYTALTVVPAQWVSTQNAEVDGISGATVTSSAVEIGMVQALLQAKK